jgi:hypothetical protein
LSVEKQSKGQCSVVSAQLSVEKQSKVKRSSSQCSVVSGQLKSRARSKAGGRGGHQYIEGGVEMVATRNDSSAIADGLALRGRILR